MYGERKVVRKIVSGIMSILLVLSMFSLSSYIQPVRASGTIYIARAKYEKWRKEE
jgi:hypothetical protein